MPDGSGGLVGNPLSTAGYYVRWPLLALGLDLIIVAGAAMWVSRKQHRRLGIALTRSAVLSGLAVPLVAKGIARIPGV